MRQLLLILTFLAFAFPAKADMYPNASNAVLPWNLTTTNAQPLNNGINLISGYTGAIDNTTVRNWGMQVQMGNETCDDQFYRFFRAIPRGFAYGLGSCTVVNAGTTTNQSIGGLFSMGSQDGYPGGAIVPLLAQGYIRGNNINMWGLNTLKSDTYNIGHGGPDSTVSGTTMTINSVVKGTFNVGDIVKATTGMTQNSYIVAQLTGTPGGAGTYQLNFPSTVTSQRITAKPFQTGNLVQDEYDHFCDLGDTLCRNIISGSFPNGPQSHVMGATVGGTIAAGNVFSITITDDLVTGSPKVVSYTAIAGDDAAKVANGLVAASHADADLRTGHHYMRAVGNVVRMYYPTNNSMFRRPTVTFTPSATGGSTLTTALIRSGNNQRFAMGVNTFSDDEGRWQIGFLSSHGCCDWALMVGLEKNSPQAIGQRGQGLKFSYTDNTGPADPLDPSAARIASIRFDPANAGPTGVDMILDNNSNQKTNLVLADGDFKAYTSSNASTIWTELGNINLQKQLNNANDNEIIFQKSRGSAGVPAVIVSSDDIGTIRFKGFDGSGYVDGASIIARSSGVIAPGTVGGVVIFAASGAERLRLTATGPSIATIPTSGGAGGLALCIDTAGVVYKKAACP